MHGGKWPGARILGYMDVPEIDGYIWVKADREVTLGKFYPVQIDQVEEYDLIGHIK